MNILVATSTFPRWKDDNGAPFVFDLCRQLSRMGAKVVVLAPHGARAQKYEMLDGIPVYRYQYLPSSWETLAYDGGIMAKLRQNKFRALQIPFFLACQLWAMRRIVSKENIDVIHAHWIIPQGLVAAFYKKMFNPQIRIVMTAHGSDLLALRGALATQLKRFTLRATDALTTVSLRLKEEAAKCGTSTPVEIVPMGVDTEKFTPDHYSDRIKEQYGIKGPFLLFVGRLASEKGAASMIEAMAEILGECPQAKLVIVGEGPQERELRQHCRELDVEKQVIFAGQVAHDLLPAYYATADLLVSPSAYEGFGLVLAEAMACGCPVIASGLPEASEIVRDGVTGFHVRSQDSRHMAETVIRLLKNRDQLSDVKEAGRKHVSAHFNLKTVGEKYSSILSAQK